MPIFLAWLILGIGGLAFAGVMVFSGALIFSAKPTAIHFLYSVLANLGLCAFVGLVIWAGETVSKS